MNVKIECTHACCRFCFVLCLFLIRKKNPTILIHCISRYMYWLRWIRLCMFCCSVVTVSLLNVTHDQIFYMQYYYSFVSFLKVNSRDSLSLFSVWDWYFHGFCWMLSINSFMSFFVFVRLCCVHVISCLCMVCVDQLLSLFTVLHTLYIIIIFFFFWKFPLTFCVKLTKLPVILFTMNCHFETMKTKTVMV
jgi:hypothetical protein